MWVKKYGAKIWAKIFKKIKNAKKCKKMQKNVKIFLKKKMNRVFLLNFFFKNLAKFVKIFAIFVLI